MTKEELEKSSRRLTAEMRREHEQAFKDDVAISALSGIIASGMGGDKTIKCRAAYDYAEELWKVRTERIRNP